MRLLETTMTPNQPAPNLLFGILALQNNFIDRDGLLTAFHAWVADRSRSLGQILVELGKLTDSRQALLEALVREQLQIHGNDVQRSLAALSSIGSVREDLSRIAAPDLHATLPPTSAAGSARSVDSPGSIAQASVGCSTSAGTRFRILRPHAKGGLGQVSVALDQERDRSVALKEIQDRHADHFDSRARFILEAEITAKLEHPGIIPVYGLGQYADGRPYYAMRFIKGDSLMEAIARFHADESLKRDPGQRALRLRELLRRFQDVCNAIAYAHSRGILHRDLKPGNIMLGPYGETLVVDWGLAKPMGSDDSRREPAEAVEEPIQLSEQSGSQAATLPGSIVGTPAYASPEQVSGQGDLLRPASDVYSLGATLYSLLTGQAPIQGNGLAEVLRKARKAEVPPARSIDPTIPQALEAICSKAMAPEPSGRYASARELAADLDRWLADEPVTAWREPWEVRARRWVRRHRTLMTAGLAFLLTAVVALALTALFLNWEKNRTEAAHQVAVANETRARRQAELARTNAAEARRQQQRAASSFAKVRIAADEYWLTRVAENYQSLNATSLDKVLKSLLDDSLIFYQSLIDDPSDQSLSEVDRARCLTVIGFIHHSAGREVEAERA
jgi:serine/threonine-protein kinase